MGAFNNLFKKIVPGKILYYPGCLVNFTDPEIEKNYETLLKQAGIEYIKVPEFVCCGAPAKNSGYQKDFYELIRENRRIFEKHKVKKIITSCPSCYLTFKNDYGLEVEHVSETIWANIDKLTLPNHWGEITYHDPCNLGRKSGIFESPRNILKFVGFKVVEFKEHGDKALCCGAGGGLKINFPVAGLRSEPTSIAL